MAERLGLLHAGVDVRHVEVLADFQSPEHADWFELSGPDGKPLRDAPPTITTLPDEAGATERRLAVRLSSTEHRLVFDLSRAPPTGATGEGGRPARHSVAVSADLPAATHAAQAGVSSPVCADWQEFGTLLLSIYGPPEGADLNFSLHAGTPARRWLQALNVGPGWNHLRVDLEPIRRQLDLANVCRLSWQLVPGGSATTLYFDDLALADRRQWLTGQHAGEGELYAFACGPRLHVGSVDRFELVFEGGAIAAWYADRPASLSAPPGLGPWPVLVPADWPTETETSLDAALIAALARAGSGGVRQTLVEASPLRVVVEGAWQAEEPSATTTPGGDRPTRYSPTQPESTAILAQHTRRYVVYADGRMFVRISATLDGEHPSAQLAHVLLLDGRAGFHVLDAAPTDPQQEPARFVLLSRAAAGAADLLWVSRPTLMGWRRVVPLGGAQQLAVLVGDRLGESPVEIAHLLCFRPAELDVISQAAVLARDYQNPVALRPTVGRLLTDIPGDLNGDGFNESEGCYELALEQGCVRFEFQPGSVPRRSPVFRIHGSAGERCWVYANGAAVPADRRDADDRVFFMLPDTIRTPRVIEVYVRPGNRTGP